MVADRGNVQPDTAGVEFTGVYIISVAARLLEMHPQTLRKYERVGLVQPSRTGGHLRLYSNEDLLRLRVIRRLVEELGLNLAGVRLVLDLVGPLRRLVDGAELNTKTLDSAAIRATAELGSFLKYVGADPDDPVSSSDLV
ncbi:MAG TPA: MerR family transcriptional regulator [Dehalococcoidia bacterium]|nr:MerR family transcriptional regulator [Dehalococcoidia bacterium]MDP7514476.1 MerR family transcriptional regulator [Dehalococcoidia bacterium]HJM54012.1 MerR family transcriptional regulator [Dehalococcoidia bacterium]